MIAPISNEEKQKLLEIINFKEKTNTLLNIIEVLSYNTQEVKILCNTINQLDLFIELKKSELFFVFLILEIRNSIPSIVPIGLIILRRTFILGRSSFANNNSSLLVP